MIIREIKKISKLHMNFIFQLRNKLYVRNASLNKEKINFKSHVLWIENFKKIRINFF